MASRQPGVSLNDQYVLLLEDSVKESRLLRKELASKEEKYSQTMSDLKSTIDSMNSKLQAMESRQGQKRTQRNASAPKRCKADFRQMYKNMMKGDGFNGFDLDKIAGDRINKQVFVKVADAIFQDYGGEDKCPWTRDQLRGASARYFKSLSDGKTRERKRNGAADHKKTCRRQGRLREGWLNRSSWSGYGYSTFLVNFIDKLQRRVVALEKITWTEETKAKARSVLVPQYTSSDESEYSEEEDEQQTNRLVLTKYRTKRLPWQRTTLTNMKEQLDKAYECTLSRHVRNARLPREIHDRPSDRPIPEDPISWAVRQPTARALMSRNVAATTSFDNDIVPSTPSASFDSNRSSLCTSTPSPRTQTPTARSRRFTYNQNFENESPIF